MTFLRCSRPLQPRRRGCPWAEKEWSLCCLPAEKGKGWVYLTKDVAKPAVHFGGKYRIIDFTLSNCAHSGIDTVGVLTQYQPLVLNTYLGIGSPWGLDRRDGGMAILPPYVKSKGGMWYKGTANAIYQNMGFIDQLRPGLCACHFRRPYL